MAVDKIFKQQKGIEVPEGSTLGLFLGLVHLGVQKNEYEGVVNYVDQVLLKFELPDQVLEDGRPITLTKRERNSTSPKSNMLKFIKAINGSKNLENGIDFEEQLGKPVLLEIKHTAKGSPSIGSYMSAPESMKKNLKPLINEPTLLLDVEEISSKELEDMPEWLQKVINGRVRGNGDVNEESNY